MHVTRETPQGTSVRYRGTFRAPGYGGKLLAVYADWAWVQWTPTTYPQTVNRKNLMVDEEESWLSE